MAFENSRAFTIDNKKVINQKQFGVDQIIEIPAEKPLKKVVSVHALPRIESSEKIADTINFTGKTNYQVVYESEDQTLNSVTYESEWQNSFNLFNEEDYFLSCTVSENKVLDFSANQVTLSTVIDVEISAVVNSLVSSISDFTDDYVVKEKNVEYNKMLAKVHEKFIEVSEDQANVDNILFSEAYVKVANVTAGVDVVEIEGSVNVVLTVLNDNKVNKIFKAIDFKQEINALGVYPESVLDIDVKLSKLIVAKSYNETDNITNIIYTVECDVQGVVFKLENATVVEDIFSTKKIITFDSECLLNETYSGNNVYENKDSFVLNLDREVSEIEYVSSLNVNILDSEVKNEILSVQGVIVADLVCRNEQNEIVNTKGTVNFKYEIENYNVSNKFNLEIYENQCKINSNKEAVLDVVAKFNIKNINDDYLSFVKSLEEVEDRVIENNSISVYVVSEQEDLFNVAKNLCVKIEEIIKQNNINEEGLKGGERLVVYNQLSINF